MPVYRNGSTEIYYEEAGSGFPLLVIPGGGLNARIPYLSTRTPFDPMDVLSDEYHCIAMDIRNANGSASKGPLEIDRPWDFAHRRSIELDGSFGDRQVPGARVLHRRTFHLEPARTRARACHCSCPRDAERISSRAAGSVHSNQYEAMGADFMRRAAGRYDGYVSGVP